jgi:hypothetical protein
VTKLMLRVISRMFLRSSDVRNASDLSAHASSQTTLPCASILVQKHCVGLPVLGVNS